MKKLLLISNSTQSGSGYLDYCADEIKDFLGNEIKNVLFIPYASNDLDGYADKARKRYKEMGYAVNSLHESDNPIQAVNEAQAIFVGGGNTFLLLSSLYDLEVIEAIKNKVENGTPYIGISAGTNISTPSIKTTNDMPIIYPPSFNALGLVHFNINPHYIDPDPNSKHQGETREQRIKEYHEINDNIVVGLREGTMLRIENDNIKLKGITSLRVFRKNETPVEYQPGANLDFLL